MIWPILAAGIILAAAIACWMIAPWVLGFFLAIIAVGWAGAELATRWIER